MNKPTTAQLRDDIDHGRTGDKVAASDPAVAPLGTDEEAAGTPVPPEAVAEARRYELRHAAAPHRAEERGYSFWILVGIAIISAVAGLGLLLR